MCYDRVLAIIAYVRSENVKYCHTSTLFVIYHQVAELKMGVRSSDNRLLQLDNKKRYQIDITITRDVKEERVDNG
jgi:hypothetical protein